MQVAILKRSKYRIDELKEKTYTYNYTVIEGDILTDPVEKITHKTKLEETLDGGAFSTVTSRITRRAIST